MAISPINILQRLLELKLQQQNLDDSAKRTKNFENSTASDYQTIAGLSAFDSTLIDENSSKNCLNWESKTIQSPRKSFHELIEEKLAEETESPPVMVQVKPKRPFLRKGKGLERFRLNPQSATKRKTLPKRSITPLRAPAVSIQPKATWSKPEAAEQISKINELASVEMTPQAGEQTLYEKALEKELKIFEELEERANNSSFCSTNSSVMRILSSTPSKKPPMQHSDAIIEEKHVRWESQSEDDEIESHLEKKDIEEILQRLQNFAESKREMSAEQRQWTSTENSSTNSSICSSDLERVHEKCDKSIGTPTFHCQRCQELEEKVDEYENKLKNFDREKRAIAELRNSYETKEENLERDFRKRIKDFHEEQDNFHIEMEQERRKLAKDKLSLQNQMRELQNKTNRREREEVTKLKQEIADLKETLKLKESKNGMTQARLRNQVKQLEKENGNLKDEVAKLTKNNAKLTATQKLQKRPSSDAKILKEINKNITKLAENKKEESHNTDQKDKAANEQQNSDDSLLEMTKFRNFSYLDVEKQYENVFKGEFKQNSSLNESKKSDRIERVLDDGSKEIKYNNGNIKTISSDGNTIIMKYFNGDIKQTFLLEGMIKYFYFDKNIWQTTFSDQSELIEFPEGPKEKRYTDGKCEIILPDNVVQTLFPDGNQEIKYTDGSVLSIKPNGDKILQLSNGQKEIETREHKRREYPDGTVKILYPDGTQETRYSNGRVRIRDSTGKLVMDTHS